MTAPEQLDLARIAAGIRAAADAAPDPWIARWGARTCRWLAAVPQWTDALAERAGFPLPPGVGSVRELVRLAEAGGVVSSRREPAPGGMATVLFWVDAATRQEWFAELAETENEDPLAAVQSIAAAVSHVEPLPAITTAWLGLGLLFEEGPDVTRLVDDVRLLVAEDELAKASTLVEAGAALAPVVGGGFPDGVARARRMLHLGHRRRRDRSMLTRFVRRREQVDPLRRLLTARADGPWALHLIGPGGVGKTMLLRYLASGLFADDAGLGTVPVARVDFDHISPDFPATRPVELLVALADELAPYADTRVRERTLRDFHATAQSVHSAAAAGPMPPDHPLLRSAVDQFGRFLALLPAPQVLVLDTCEELAKLHPAGEEVPAVTRTFALLDALHQQCPSLRVVLAGRRYLASGGAGWTLPEGIQQRSVVSLAQRPHLGLEELKGFDRREAVEVLSAPYDGRTPDDALVAAMLDRSPELGADGRAPEPDRYNPFLVAHHRGWWEDEPGLTPDDLTDSGYERYVQGRIVGRLHDREIEHVLPALALLGRLDEAVLAEALPAESRAQLPQVVEKLAEQEWIDVALDRDTGLRVLAVGEGYLPMLRVWAERTPSAQSAAVQATLTKTLLNRLDDAELSTLTPELVIAALRLSPVEDAAPAWAGVEVRIARTGRWEWAATLLGRVGAELEDELANRPLLDAVLSATALAAQRRLAPGINTAARWRRIERLIRTADDVVSWSVPRFRVDGISVAGLRSELELRAQAWSLAAFSKSKPTVSWLLTALRVGGSPVLLGTLVGVLEAALADLPRGQRLTLGQGVRQDVVTAAEAVENKLAGPDPALLAGALVALSTLLTDPERTVLLDQAAEHAKRAFDTRERLPTWADRPLFDRRDPRLWVALHQAAWAVARDADVGVIRLDVWRTMAEYGKGVDADRLASCVVTLSRGILPDLTDVADESRYDPTTRPNDAIHHEVQPLFVAAAKEWFRAGQPRAAEGLLDRWRSAAVSGRVEDGSVRIADEAMLWLAARMRWTAYRSSLVRAFLHRDSLDRGALLAGALEVLADGAGASAMIRRSGELASVDGDLYLEVRLTGQVDDDVVAEALSRVEAIKTSDPVTACQLATTVALAQAGPARDDTVALVRSLYRVFAERAGLPEWSAVASPTSRDDPWREWRMRWASLQRPVPDGEAVTRSTGTGERSIPIPESPAPPQSPGAGSAPSAGSPRRGALLTYLVGAIVVAVLLAPVFVFVDAAGTGSSTVSGTGVVAYVVAVLAGIPALALLALRRVLRRRPPAWLLRRCTLQLTVDDDYVRAAVRPTTLGARILLGPELDRGMSPADQPLRGDDSRLQMVIATCRATILGGFHAATGPVDWEHGLVDLSRSSGAWRGVWVRDVPGRPPAWGEPGTLVEADPAWRDRLRRAYPKAATGSVARVRHVVGEPIATDRGPILQIGRGESLKGERERAGTYWTTQERRSEVYLTVIQQTPDDEAWLHREPVIADRLRQLGTDAARKSHGYVLVLPAVPETTAGAIWRLLATFADRRRAPDRFDLVRLVREIKALIAPAAPPATYEIAQDVLLLGPWTSTS